MACRRSGGDPRDPRVRARTGYLPAEARLEPRLRVGVLVDLFTRLRDDASRRRAGQLCERLRLDIGRVAEDLSTGNRRKVGLVLVLAHEPELLLLDEPTSGLDPLTRREVAALVREAADRGAGVLYSSHTLPEVADLADRVVALRSGRVVEELTADRIAGWGRQRVEARLAAPAPTTLLDGVTGVRSWSADGCDVRADVVGPVASLVRALAPVDVQTLHVQDAELEELFSDRARQTPEEGPA